MSAQEILDSGMLEDYVLGLLSESEMQQLQLYLQQYPELNTEVLALQNGLAQYTLQYTRNPNPLLREKVLSTFKSTESELSPQKDWQQAYRNLKKLTLAITTLGILLSFCFLGLWLYNAQSVTELKTQYHTISNQKQQMEKRCRLLKAEHDALIVKDAFCHSIVRLCDKKSNRCMAVVYWNHLNKNAYCNTESLPQLPPDKVYRLWCIADNKPMDAGLLNKKEEGLQVVQRYDKIDGFAVTIEPKSGASRSTPPAADEIMLFGTKEHKH